MSVRTAVNIVIVGGCGFWSDKNHYKNILALKQKNTFKVRVVAIIDPCEPRERSRHTNLQKILDLDHPQHINPELFANVQEVFSKINNEINLVIVASGPSSHYEYIKYCLENRIEILIDKPVLVSENAASKVSQAKKIKTQFDELLKLYYKNVALDPNYKAVTMLRRRSLESFNFVAEEIKKVYDQYGAWINIMNIAVHGGIQKMPQEFLGNIHNAHGYAKGVGSLAHSAYHYIDIMNWYLDLTKGEPMRMHITLNYVRRVEDHLLSEGHSVIQNIISATPFSYNYKTIDKSLLNAELDVGFTIKMIDNDDNITGQVTFIFNHTSFSPRTRKIELEEDSGNFETGGRMSNFYIEIHQAGVQTWQIKKNDVVFTDNSIHIFGRKHPKIGPVAIEKSYEKAYDNTKTTMPDLFENLIEAITKSKRPTMEGLRSISDEKINMNILYAFYYLISLDLSKKTRKKDFVAIDFVN